MAGRRTFKEVPLPSRLGLRPRSVIAVIIALLPFFLLLYLNLQERKAEAERAARDSARSLLSVVVERYRDQMDLAGETLFLLSRAEEVRSARWEQVGELLREIHQHRPQYDDLGVLDPQGNLVVSAVPPPGPLNVADREYFQRAMSTRRLAVSGYLVSRLTGNKVIIFAFPVVDELGAVRVVLVAPLNLGFIHTLLAEVGIPRGCELMVADSKGTLLVHLPEGRDTVGQEIGDEELLEHLLGGKGAEELRTSRGRVYFMSTVAHPGQEGEPCHVVLGYDMGAIYGPARSDFLRGLAILSLMTSLVFLLILFYLDRSLLRPVRELVVLVENAGRDLAVEELSGHWFDRDPGEIGVLRASYLRMLGRVKAREEERDRALERASKLGRFYAMLSSTNRAIVHSRDEAELLGLICRIAVEEGGFLLAWVGRLDDESGVVEVVAAHGVTGYLDSLTVKAWEGEESKGPTGTALREGRPVACKDIASDPRMAPWRERALSFGFRSSCALPLRRGGKVWGALNVYSDRPGYFDPEETALLEEMAADLSYALGALDEEAARRRGEENLRWTVQTLLNLGPEPMANLPMLLDLSLRVTGAGLAKYLRRRGDRYKLVASSSGMERYTPSDLEGDAKLVESAILWHNGPFHGDVEEVLRRFDPDVERHGLKSLLGFPVFMGEEIKGVLCLYRQEAREFTREEVDLAGMVAKAISVEEERWEREESIRDFLEVASHELRHPITVLKGFSLTLLRHGERLGQEEVREMLQEISRGADRLDAQLRDLLDLSRVERLGAKPNKREASVGALVTGAVEEAEERYPGREFRVRLEPEEMRAVLDLKMTQQVLLFLLDNACKFSSPGTPVEVEVKREEGELVFSVLDRGRGIPEWDRERVFERFYQVEEVLHHSTPGLGLGLYLARRLVEAQGGRIWCKAREGGGSVFSFALPLEEG